MSSFPIGSSILLQGLVGAAQYNDKKGMVRSNLNAATGRQEVYVFDAKKSMAIKPSNMKYEPREISSLSVPDLKGLLLVSKKLETEPDEWKGLDKEDLRKMAAEVTTSPDEIAALVAKANEPKGAPPAAKSQTGKFTGDQLRQGAERMSQMSPEGLKQQAATMRAMGPAALRNMNPAMAHMSDAQINMAIEQMESIANNPAMMKMASEQMKNMSPDELNQAVQQDPAVRNLNSNASTPSSSATKAVDINSLSSDQFKEATQKMASLSPDQLKAQTDVLKSMSMDTLRKTNPQMAHMTDDQIRMSIAQMEKMAEDPAMLKMAAEQMKNMTPEQLESMKKMMGNEMGSGMNGSSSSVANGGSANASNGAAGMGGFPTDPSQMLESLLSNPEQLSSMIKTMKQNPEMMKQMVASQMGGAMSDAKREQMEKAIDQFTQMDEKQLDRYIKTATFVQKAAKPFLGAWNGTKRVMGVSSKTLFILMNIVIIGSFVSLVVWKRSRGEVDGLEDTLSSLSQDEPQEMGQARDGEF